MVNDDAFYGYFEMCMILSTMNGFKEIHLGIHSVLGIKAAYLEPFCIINVWELLETLNSSYHHCCEQTPSTTL